MDQIWERIEAWLRANAPELAAALNPPASAEQIAATERALGIQFPADVRATYFRHDGQDRDAPGLLDGWEWLSLERIQEEWQVWKGLLDGGDFANIQSEGDGQNVRQDWWHPAWIPLTYNGSGDHDCLDLAPGQCGLLGQIIRMYHDEGSRPVVARSFSAWLARFAADLEAGEYILSEEYGGLCRRDDV